MKGLFEKISAIFLWLASLQVISIAQPNIVFIMADDLAWSDVSSDLTTMGNGSSYHETPNIDQLALEGLSFTQAYVQQNCAPTRAALISGQYAPHPRNGVYNVNSLDRADSHTAGYPNLPINPAGQNNNISTGGLSLHEMLQSAGYHTSWFGKNHGTGWVSNLSADHGVDYNVAVSKKVTGTVNGSSKTSNFLALEDDSEGWIFASPALKAYAQPYDAAYVSNIALAVANGNDPMLAVGTPKHLTDALGDAAVDYIRDRTLTGEPFFLYLPFHAVHTGIVSRPDLTAKYEAKVSTDPRHDSAKYAGLTELMDQNVGKVLHALDDPDGDGNPSDSMAANTLVIFCSDNGGAGGQTDNSPLRGEKGMFYEGGIRVPLICRWPGVVSAGTTHAQSIHCVDMYPTMAEVAGAALPDPSVHALDGESFAPILRGEKAALDRESIYWHFPGYMDDRQRPNSVIQSRVNGAYYKLFFYYEDGRYELYNLTQDFTESTDLLTGSPSEETMAIAEQMNTDLRNWLIRGNAATGSWVSDGKPVAYPPADMQSHLIPANAETILFSDRFEANTEQNPFYPGPGQQTITISRTNVYDSADFAFIPAGVTVGVAYHFDIRSGPTGTISQNDSSINKGIGVDDGDSDTVPDMVDADSGSGNPEWLKIENLTLDDVTVSDPSLLPAVSVSNIRMTNLRPAWGSSSDLVIAISKDADAATTGDNDVRSKPAGTLVINSYQNDIDYTDDFHLIVMQGTLWLKGLEVSCSIQFGLSGPPEVRTLKLSDWAFDPSFERLTYATWFSSADKTYSVESSTNLTSGFVPVTGLADIAGQAGYFTTVLDAGLPQSDALFVRILEK